MQVNILEAKNRLSELVKSAQAGGEVIIANRGVPVARLVATEAAQSPRSTKGRVQDLLAWLKAEPLPAHLQRSASEIDADIQREHDAWD